MTRSRTITIPIKRKTADVFDAVLDSPKKILSYAQKSDDGWWSFLNHRGNTKPRFNSNKELGELNPQIIEKSVCCNVPIKIISSGTYSEIIVTLFKPEQITEQEFVNRVREAEMYIHNMKQIIEQI